MAESSTRQDIVAAADDLFYRRGFDHTSFADIASAVDISRGNFYHHFKSKDDILAAVIESRMLRTAAMLQGWVSDGDDPEVRLRSFVNILVTNGDKISRHGCPVGTLCTELAKLAHPSQEAANGVLGLFRQWLRAQFELLGHRRKDADELALHLLARTQGIAVLATAAGDGQFLRRETRHLQEWVKAQCHACPRGSRGSRRASAESGRRAS